MAPEAATEQAPWGAGTLRVLNPATGAELGTVATTPPDQMATVVNEARRVQPLWSLLRLEDRCRYMRRLAQAVIDEFDELVDLLAREGGRPRAEAATLELLPAIDALIWIADDGARMLGGLPVGIHRSMFPVKRARVAFEPFGVVAVIGAGSAPFAQPLGQIAGALVAGNAVVFKPAARASLTGARIARLVARAGLPEGLVRVIHGGARHGLALAEAPVDKVLFTGSPAAGRGVARACVSQDREVAIEIGGKDAMLVLADANVGRAVQGALWAGLAAAGQARGAVERIYVAREVADRFVAELTSAAAGLTVGDPLLAETQVGPLASNRRLERVCTLVEQAVAQGAHQHCGGPVQPTGCNGAFYAPAVLSDVTHDMRVMREPVDGPVLPVMAVDSPDEAITCANDSEYGLGASVWTADRYHAQRMARELRAGMVWLNDHLAAPAVSQGPWGAAAGAGLGRTLGQSGLRACAQEKLITWDPPGPRGLWWGPYTDNLTRAARSFAQLRSARDSDRSRAWRHGGRAMARLGARALGRS
jgi:acyl-CoA reductase-like NAD-dependent aldehyde dehydrogenase